MRLQGENCERRLRPGPLWLDEPHYENACAFAYQPRSTMGTVHKKGGT